MANKAEPGRKLDPKKVGQALKSARQETALSFEGPPAPNPPPQKPSTSDLLLWDPVRKRWHREPVVPCATCDGRDNNLTDLYLAGQGWRWGSPALVPDDYDKRTVSSLKPCCYRKIEIRCGHCTGDPRPAAGFTYRATEADAHKRIVAVFPIATSADTGEPVTITTGDHVGPCGTLHPGWSIDVFERGRHPDATRKITTGTTSVTFTGKSYAPGVVAGWVDVFERTPRIYDVVIKACGYLKGNVQGVSGSLTARDPERIRRHITYLKVLRSVLRIPEVDALNRELFFAGKLSTPAPTGRPADVKGYDELDSAEKQRIGDVYNAQVRPSPRVPSLAPGKPHVPVRLASVDRAIETAKADLREAKEAHAKLAALLKRQGVYGVQHFEVHAHTDDKYELVLKIPAYRQTRMLDERRGDMTKVGDGRSYKLTQSTGKQVTVRAATAKVATHTSKRGHKSEKVQVVGWSQSRGDKERTLNVTDHKGARTYDKGTTKRRAVELAPPTGPSVEYSRNDTKLTVGPVSVKKLKDAYFQLLRTYKLIERLLRQIKLGWYTQWDVNWLAGEIKFAWGTREAKLEAGDPPIPSIVRYRKLELSLTILEIAWEVGVGLQFGRRAKGVLYFKLTGKLGLKGACELEVDARSGRSKLVASSGKASKLTSEVGTEGSLEAEVGLKFEVGTAVTVSGAMKAGIKMEAKWTFSKTPGGTLSGEFTGVEGAFTVVVLGGAFSWSRKANPITKRSLFKDVRFPKLDPARPAAPAKKAS